MQYAVCSTCTIAEVLLGCTLIHRRYSVVFCALATVGSQLFKSVVLQFLGYLMITYLTVRREAKHLSLLGCLCLHPIHTVVAFFKYKNGSSIIYHCLAHLIVLTVGRRSVFPQQSTAIALLHAFVEFFLYS